MRLLPATPTLPGRLARLDTATNLDIWRPELFDVADGEQEAALLAIIDGGVVTAMNDTYHDTWPLAEDRLSEKYWLHDGKWEVMGGVPPAMARANAGLISTAWDFAKFCQMLLDKGAFSGGALLKPETMELATSPLTEVSEAYLSVEVESGMGFESEWYEYRDARALNIDRWRGLGFVVSDTGVFSHAGIYGTFFYVDPARELFGIILTQSIYGGNPGQAFIEAINEAVID